MAGRKLACFAAAFSVFLGVFCYGLPRERSFVWGLAAGGLLLLTLWLCAGWRQAALTTALAFLLAGGVFAVGLLQPYRRAQALDGTRGAFEAEVAAQPREGEYYTVLDGARMVDGSRATVIIYQTGLDLRPGDRISFEGRAACNSGRYFFSSMAEGSFLTLRASKGFVSIPADPVPLRYWPARFAGYIRESVIERYLEGDRAGLMAALLTGDKTGMSRQVKNQLALSGTSHITAVSGMHVGILSGFFIALLGRRRGAWASLPFLLFFGMMTGMNPPVVRAVLMAALVFLAFAVDRENDGITTVLTALMVVGVFAPCTFVSVSLQMSFAAVLGILLLDQPIQRTLTALLPAAWAESPWGGKILPGLAVSISASLAALPVTAVYFERISVLAPLTNLAVLWLVPVLMGGGILLLLLVPIPAAAAVFARFGLDPLLRLFLCIVAWFAGLPWNSVAAGDGLAFGLLALWGIWLCAGFSIRPRIRLTAGALLLCLTLTLSGLRLYTASQMLSCTVWADGMVIVQQGGKTLGLLPGGTETLADAYTDRFFALGKTGADLLVFTDPGGETRGQIFCAGQILRPGAAGEDAGPMLKTPERAAVRLGKMTVAAWGSSGMPQGVTVQWKDRTILCACGTQQVLSAPDLAKTGEEADLLILDGALTEAGSGLDRLLARTAPRRILVCDPGKDADLARIGQIAGRPIEWVRETAPWMTEWKEEE